MRCFFKNVMSSAAKETLALIVNNIYCYVQQLQLALFVKISFNTGHLMRSHSPTSHTYVYNWPGLITRSGLKSKSLAMDGN